MDRIYLDNAATTPIAPEVIDAMVESLTYSYGNPSSTHSFGQEVREKVELVRRNIASKLHVKPGEIVFTSCGTESNNLAIRGSVEHLGVKRIITSPLEHKCVEECTRAMKKIHGVELVYIKPDSLGNISSESLREALAESREKTLVSIMHANNEIGNLIDLKEFALICKEYDAYFHTDTVQTIGHLDLNFEEIPVDFASCSAHKFHGPKGIGFAFIRKNLGLKSIICGGPQERNLRAGTENVSGIVGLGKAFDLAYQDLDSTKEFIKEIKKYCIESLQVEFPDIQFNGESGNMDKSLYTVLSVLLPFYDPMIGFKLDMKGIAISQGSACSSGAASMSGVMMRIIPEHLVGKSTPLRVSFSSMTRKEDIDKFIACLVAIKNELKLNNFQLNN